MAESQSSTIDQHLQALRGLSDHACKFHHENSDLMNPPLCSDELREVMLGCAHSGNKILYEAIQFCRQIKIITASDADALKETLDGTELPLLRLDGYAAHEYKDGDCAPTTVSDQCDIIDKKKIIRDRLVGALEAMSVLQTR